MRSVHLPGGRPGCVARATRRTSTPRLPPRRSARPFGVAYRLVSVVGHSRYQAVAQAAGPGYLSTSADVAAPATGFPPTRAGRSGSGGGEPDEAGLARRVLEHDVVAAGRAGRRAHGTRRRPGLLPDAVATGAAAAARAPGAITGND